MLKLIILLYLFLIGLNFFIGSFFEEKRLNNKEFILSAIGYVVLDMVGIYLFYFLLPPFLV